MWLYSLEHDNIAHIAVQLQPNDRVQQLGIVLIIQIVLQWTVGRSAQR